MASYERSIEIQAPPRTVIGLLHDLGGWTSWTSTVLEATPLGTGEVRPGARVRARQPGLPVSVWTVDAVDDETFEWNNFRHGLRTVATHRITPTPTGSTLSVTIRQEGILVPAVSLVRGGLIRRHLQQMTEDIKKAAEASAAGPETLDLDGGSVDAEPQQQLSGRLGKKR
jgi:hypothetical protein